MRSTWTPCLRPPGALRPGDVLRAMNGTTIEVGNTDAEGRLTLADAICYAGEKIELKEAKKK